jgi:hypothetical protein
MEIRELPVAVQACPQPKLRESPRCSASVSRLNCPCQICSVVIDFMYYLSGYISDTYFTSWIYVVTDWSVSRDATATYELRR